MDFAAPNFSQQVKSCRKWQSAFLLSSTTGKSQRFWRSSTGGIKSHENVASLLFFLVSAIGSRISPYPCVLLRFSSPRPVPHLLNYTTLQSTTLRPCKRPTLGFETIQNYCGRHLLQVSFLCTERVRAAPDRHGHRLRFKRLESGWHGYVSIWAFWNAFSMFSKRPNLSSGHPFLSLLKVTTVGLSCAWQLTNESSRYVKYCKNVLVYLWYFLDQPVLPLNIFKKSTFQFKHLICINLHNELKIF